MSPAAPEPKRGKLPVVAVVAATAVAGAVLTVVGLGVVGFLVWGRGPRTPPPVWREFVTMKYAKGQTAYEVNGRIVGTEAELTAELRKVLARRELRKGDGIIVEFMIVADIAPGDEGLTQQKMDKARAACQAAGARVEGMPGAPPPIALDVPAAKPARLESIRIEAVGVRDGVLQYRIGKDAGLIAGEAELTEAVRARIFEFRKADAGLIAVSPSFFPATELVIPDERRTTIEKAVQAAGPEVGPLFGYRDGGGRKNSRRVQVYVTGPLGAGNRYLFNGQTLDGEKALADALLKELAAFRAGKEGALAQMATLYVELRVEVKPGITVSEEQLSVARRTVEASGVEKPLLVSSAGRGDRHILLVELVGFKDGRARFKLEDKEVEGEKALTEALRAKIAALTQEAGHAVAVTPNLRAAEGLEVSREQQDAAEKALMAAGPEVLGVMSGGGRRRVAGRLDVVRLMAPGGHGPRYAIGETVFDGGDALTAALKDRLAKFKAEPANSGKLYLVRIEAEGGAGLTERDVAAAEALCRAAGVGILAAPDKPTPEPAGQAGPEEKKP